MVISCSAYGCTNRQGKKEGISFYRFPVNEERRAKWTVAMKRINWVPSSTSRICSEHFISGKKSENPLSPDYVPSLFSFVPLPRQRKKVAELEQFERRQIMKRRKREQHQRFMAAKTCLELPGDMDGIKLDVGMNGIDVLEETKEGESSHQIDIEHTDCNHAFNLTGRKGKQPKHCKQREHEMCSYEYSCKSPNEVVVVPEGSCSSDEEVEDHPVYSISHGEIHKEHNYCKDGSLNCCKDGTSFTEIYVKDKATATSTGKQPEFSEDPLFVENHEAAETSIDHQTPETYIESNNVFECAKCKRLYMWKSTYKGLLYHKQVISFNCAACGEELRKEIRRPGAEENGVLAKEDYNNGDFIGDWVELSDKIKSEKQDNYLTEEESIIKGKDWTAECMIKQEDIKEEFSEEEYY